MCIRDSASTVSNSTPETRTETTVITMCIRNGLVRKHSLMCRALSITKRNTYICTLGLFSVGSTWYLFTSVSYTHLDVYKRQL